MQLYLHYWVPANKLSKNEHLKAPGGATVAVVGGTTPKQHDGWMWDLTVPGNNDHDFYVVLAQQGSQHASYVEPGNTPVLVHNSDCGPTGRAFWQLTKDGSSAMKRGGPFKTTFYQSASDGTWWTPDVAGHGSSAFKVYEQTSKGLQWIKDADQYGDYIDGKWKGNTGYFIPSSQLRGVG